MCVHDNKLINAKNETISRTKYVFQNESIRKVMNESVRKVGTKKKYSRTNQFSSLGAECIITIVQLSLLSFKRCICLVPYCIIA